MTVKDHRPRSDRTGRTTEAAAPSPPEDPGSLRADIAATRSALGTTVEELADRVNPVAQTKRVARRFRAATSRRARSGGSGAAEVVSRRWVPLQAVAAGVAGAVVAGVAAWVLVRPGRR